MCVEGVGGAGGGGGGVVGGVGRGSPHKKKEHLVGKIAKASNTAEKRETQPTFRRQQRIENLWLHSHRPHGSPFSLDTSQLCRTTSPSLPSSKFHIPP